LPGDSTDVAVDATLKLAAVAANAGARSEVRIANAECRMKSFFLRP
jgi:hypothetical protein